MLGKKLFRTMKLYKAQFISMILMITLGVGSFVGFNIEWKSLEYNMNNFFRNTGLADFRVYDENGITKNNLEKISNINGVNEVSRVFSASADVKGTKGDTVALAVTENPKVNGFKIIDGKKYDPNSKKDILLSDKYAKENNVKIGDEMTILYGERKFKGNVSALIKAGEQAVCVRDMSQLMPDYKTHGFAYISPKFYESVIGTEFYPSVYVCSNLNEKEFTEKIENVFDKKIFVATKDDVAAYAGPMDEIDEGKTMASLLPPIFLVIAFLTMISTMNRIVVKEKIQIGTLKALGFKDKKILWHYTSYGFIVAIIGTFLGVLLGYGVGYMIDNPNGNMGEYMDMPDWKLIFPVNNIPVLISIIILMTLIGYLSTRKMLQGNPADSLRAYVPKNIKPMIIEKTKFFEKLSFGSRWNLRDTIRHKTRTLMSILGVVGCIIILICVLGMRDSVVNFIEEYYKDSMNYTSRIYLEENVTEKQYEFLMDKYNGDSSCSMPMDLNNKSVILEIHSNEHEMIKFISDKDKNVKLKDNGAYVCMRLAKEFNLKKGDTFTVAPFGTNDKYQMKVAGIVRNISESFFISDEYAKKIDLNYIADSIYTDTIKNEIPLKMGVNNVQSKDMIGESFDSFMEIMSFMISLLILLGVFLGIVVLYNLGTMMYTERYRELATLKVIGFKDKKIASILHGQTLWTTIIGIIIGIPIGIITLDYLIITLGERYEMSLYLNPISVILSIILTVGVSLFVSFIIAKKSKKIDMVSSLKGI